MAASHGNDIRVNSCPFVVAPQIDRPWSRLAACCLAIAVVLLIPSRATTAPSTPNALLLDAALAGSHVVAVGERGTILRSDDAGKTWGAAKTPTFATLTGVSFADAQHGWAVGHDALILVTTNGGATWSKQWQGETLSDSFLDVLALDAQRVIAVGAYGLCLATENGGKSWARRKIIADDYHLNRISRGPTGTLYLAGEHGTVLRSGDAGAHWTTIPTSYDGSFYGILPLARRTLLAYGLRGRAFRSVDDGATWSPVLTGKTALLATGLQRHDGAVVLGGQIRSFLVSADGGETFSAQNLGLPAAVAELLELPNGQLLAVGEMGAVVLNDKTREAERVTP